MPVRPRRAGPSRFRHGPKFGDGRRRRKTFVIAFLDDATRVIAFAAFAFAENTTAFLPVFKNALIRRGLPLRLYVDNGASYRSQPLALVRAKLGIALIHAGPYQPAGKADPEVARWRGKLPRRAEANRAIRRAGLTGPPRPRAACAAPGAAR